MVSRKMSGTLDYALELILLFGQAGPPSRQYGSAMAVRPTDHWRQGIADEKREVASGQLDPEEAVMADLFPDSMLSRTDEVLSSFESEIRAFSDPSDEQVFGAVERVVLALNAVNRDYQGAAYETSEREALCMFIDTSLGEAAVDVVSLCARRGLSRYAVTDQWRRW
jgi:hypothetical protein